MAGPFKNRDYRKSTIVLLCLVILFSLGVMGISFAYFTDNLQLEMGVNAGQLAAEVSLQAGTSPEWTLVGNTLTLNAGAAHALDNYTVYYRVRNTGTVPIKFYADVNNDPDGIITTSEPSSGDPAAWPSVDAGQQSATYTITATVPAGAVAGNNFSFTAAIKVKQWN